MPHPKTQSLALFDFDQTLILENSLGALLRRQGTQKGSCGPFWLEALGIFFHGVVYREGIRQAVKHRLYKRCLAFSTERDVLNHGHELAHGFQPAIEVVQRLRKLAAEGVEIWIVTATPRPFVQGIVEAMQWPVTHVIGTEIPTLDDQRYSGKSHRECRREEKVRRLKETLGDWRGEIVAAYGNAPADLPMLGLAKTGYVVHRGRIITR